MYHKVNGYYVYGLPYLKVKTLYNSCRWWEFLKKRKLKKSLDWYSHIDSVNKYIQRISKVNSIMQGNK